MDWSADQLARSEDNLYYGYHAADPAPTDPLPHFNLDTYCYVPFDGGYFWVCDCYFCWCMSVSSTDLDTSSISENPNQMAVNSVSSQLPLENSILDGQELVSRRNDCTTAAPAPDVSLQCKWEGCCYSRSFMRKAELKRHVQYQHIAPGSHPCPVQNCHKTCNRPDNLLQHMKNRHEITKSHVVPNNRNTMQPQVLAVPLKCKWEFCSYPESFKCVTDLVQHVLDSHITHGESSMSSEKPTENSHGHETSDSYFTC